jgi:putative ABC transport system permease protein
MISHYFKLAQKSIAKNKYYTFINVFGLVFGMLSALIIAKYIGGSLEFDSFHLKRDKIHSVTQEEFINNSPQKNRNATYWGVGELILQYPEVINMTRYYQHVESLIIADDEKGDQVSFTENKIFAADSGFLNIFTFPLIHGNSKTALSRVNSVILTNSTSQKYFGKANPVGKLITIRVPWGAETMYEVTGVTEDLPQRSRFKFDFLITQPPFSTPVFWDVPDYSTYVLLKENVKTSELSKTLSGTLNEVALLKSTNRKVMVSLQSFANVELSITEYLLAAVGIFIILISWVNYINQTIAQSYWRVKEIGILRVMGATRANLKTQFIVESSIICLTSLILVIAVYLSLEPLLQSFTDGHLLPLIGDPTIINVIFLAIFTGGIALAAAIPAVILFSQNFGTTLRNMYSSKIGSMGLRKALVIVQFSISTILMISIFVIGDQLEYMKSKDKGIAMENILIVKAPMVKDTTWEAKRETLELFKEKCSELPFITEITSSTTVPSEEYRQETYLSFQDKNDKALVHQNGVDEHFFDLYDVNFVAGRNFIPDARWKNRRSIILNESAARALGIADFDKVINTKIVDHESNEVYDLIGIVKDYHQTSLKYEMRPLAFRFNIQRGHFSLKINRTGLNDNNLAEKLDAVKQIWQQIYHEAFFDYFFLDEKFEAQDTEDRYFGKLFEYFTVLSIIISCLGLFGLSLLISTKRQKEIGVRKVFGASSIDISATFLKGYLESLLISVAIGSPLAYLLMDMWLRNYAYRIEIGFELVAIAILSLTLIFLFTVCYHTIKSSLANPVTILRD